jgi:hypothetical protein
MLFDAITLAASVAAVALSLHALIVALKRQPPDLLHHYEGIVYEKSSLQFQLTRARTDLEEAQKEIQRLQNILHQPAPLEPPEPEPPTPKQQRATLPPEATPETAEATDDDTKAMTDKEVTAALSARTTEEHGPPISTTLVSPGAFSKSFRS